MGRKAVDVFFVVVIIKISLAQVTHSNDDNTTIAATALNATYTTNDTFTSSFTPALPNDTTVTTTASLPFPVAEAHPPAPPVCSQGPVRGDCKALLRRYFYDFKTGACREFFYGGCGGNENNFLTKQECEAKCLPTGATGAGLFGQITVLDTAQNYTVLRKFGQCPPSNDPFHNVTAGNVTVSCSQSCTQDVDCPNEQLCCNVDACGRALCLAPITGPNTWSHGSLAVAAPVSTNPVCQLTLDVGPCRAYFPRWGFDGSGCVQFVWGGCRGNDNNFETQAICESVCGIVKAPAECPQIKVVPPPGCEVIASATSQNGCPIPEIRCTDGPCSANPCPNLCDNCINEPKQCVTTPCQQYRCEARENCSTPRLLPIPPLPTPPPTLPATIADRTVCALVLCAPNTVCRDIQGLATCVPDQQTASLSKASTSAQAICQLEPDVGQCRAAIERWYFNMRTSRCDSFLYGGCAGNDNNFDSRRTCETFCANFIDTANSEKQGQCPPVDQGAQLGICAAECETDVHCPGDRKCCPNACGGRVCLVPTTGSTTVTNSVVVTGPSVSNVSWIIHPAGNITNGSAPDEAALTAHKRQSPSRAPSSLETIRRCHQPADPGPCKAAFQRWYFDSVSGACEEFMFGGCEGNSNNFEAQEECEHTCDQVPACPQLSPAVPPDGCNAIGWTGIDGCTKMGFNCTEGQCQHAQCTEKCDYCVNDPKQCITAPCPQYRCQTNESCVYEQCSVIKCTNGTTCRVVNGTAACVPDALIGRCTQPRDPGPCEAALIRFYFNSGTGQCEQFVYGGCDGNSNRFGAFEECQRACSSVESA